MTTVSPFLRDLAIILNRANGWILVAIVIAILALAFLLWMDWPRAPKVRITPPDHRVDERQVFESVTTVRRLEESRILRPGFTHDHSERTVLEARHR